MEKQKWVLMVVLVGLIGGLVYWGIKDGQSSKQELKEYKADSGNGPRLVVGEKFKDVGTMGLKETATAEFVLKNEGKADLQIFYGTTNCGCTFGQVEVDGKKSPTFGMHSNQNFLISVPPGKEFKVKAIYKPFLMPVSGDVQRAVVIKTNDPKHKEVEFIIKANVKG
ncbi:MAG: DUF1573 domain-containing protein [bacterium]|nr:DUF1573 domain-containing protein [bacterium]